MEQMQIGPAGGNGGKPFDHYDVPAGARLTAIHVFTEWVLNAIQFRMGPTADGRPPMAGWAASTTSCLPRMRMST